MGLAQDMHGGAGTVKALRSAAEQLGQTLERGLEVRRRVHVHVLVVFAVVSCCQWDSQLQGAPVMRSMRRMHACMHVQCRRLDGIPSQAHS
jgi:hypothetical protein